MDKQFPYKSLKITRRQGGLHSSLWWSLPLDTPMGAIHLTKIFGNFGPKLNGSVRSNRKSFEKTGPPCEVVLFSRSDRSEFWLNGPRPLCALNLKTFSQTAMTDFLTFSYTPYRQLKGVSPGLRLVS